MIFQKNRIVCTKISISIILLFFSFLSCQQDFYSDDEDKKEEWGLIDAYISIAINNVSNSQTKSNPAGGENGNGTETGFDNENKIENLNIIFYKAADINSAVNANTPISAVHYISSANISLNNKTTVQKIKLEKTSYRMITITNSGDLSTVLSGKTVKDVANYIQKQAWVVHSEIYSQFVMASANDDLIDLNKSTSEASPALIDVDVERLAARVDVIPNQGLSNTNRYEVRQTSNVVAHNTIVRAKLINRFTAGSYLLKRVANTIEGSPSFLGQETPNTGIQTNYVLDPWSKIKIKNNLSGFHFDVNNGGSGTYPATALYADYFDSNFSLDNSNNLKSNISGKNFYILGYTLENTMASDAQLNGYTTGVMFETSYVPAKVTNYNAINKKNEVKDNSSAITFFTIDNGNSIYNSLESITFSYIKSALTNDFFSTVFTTSNTWNEVKIYASYLNNDLLGFKAYLDNLLTGKNLTNHLPSSISWSSFVLDRYGYSLSGSTVNINQNGKDTKDLLAQQGIRTYENGICYYPYWIRHSNDNLANSGIMEFAIVRNNVYKLKVLSFSGLGKPKPYDPDIDNPENPGEESYINIEVKVKPWKLIQHPEIVF